MDLTTSQWFFLVSAVAGGLAMFLFGMHQMSVGLRRAAGASLRALLTRATTYRVGGLLFGAVLGALVHSSAATVMTVGFVNAGLLALARSLPVVVGANVGTTLSMQVVSLHLTDYAFFGIGAGFLMWAVAPRPRLQDLGQTLFGFGLLFLGLDTMSEAIVPYRAELQPLLAFVDASTWSGLLFGVGIAAMVTAVIQSSGATIGMAFSLVATGVFTRLDQTLPIVLGAHLGTCATALIGSVGTNVDARRVALGHLLFNVFNVGLAIVAAPVFVALVEAMGGDVIRQTANLHTVVMLAAAVVVLPLTGFGPAVLAKLQPSEGPPPEPSHLSPGLLATPEQALRACILEIRRVTSLCHESLVLNGRIVLKDDRPLVRRVRKNEEAINEVKTSVRVFLRALARRSLSRRQTLLLQYLDRAVIEVERIGDHVDSLCDVSVRRRSLSRAQFDKAGLDLLFGVFERTVAVVDEVVGSLDPDLGQDDDWARSLLEARKAYRAASASARERFGERVERGAVTPTAGMVFDEYITHMDRIVRHAKVLAKLERRRDFWIRQEKLDRVVPEQATPAPLQRVSSRPYLEAYGLEDEL